MSMPNRFLVLSGSLALAAAIAFVGSTPVLGQSPSKSNDDGAAKRDDERALIQQVADGLKAKDARPAVAPRNWKPGRTAWGDPDLSGVYSNSEESGIPFEKPAAFGDRRLEDITPAELAKLNQSHQEQTIDRAASATEDPNGHPQLFWWENLNPENSRAWLVSDPPDGHIPAMTADGRRRAAEVAARRRGNGFDTGPFDGPEDLSLYDRCITRGLPGSMMPSIYGSSYQIIQGPGYVGIIYEMVHETRIIPLDVHPHVDRHIQTYMGDPRGHWEGNTLVVETTNFKDDGAYRGASGGTLRLVERFKPVGPAAVDWSTTVDDPATWTRPWTFGMNLTKKDESKRPFEYACNEGNYGLRNILSAARAADVAAAQAAKP
jgi:hypothetical protein